MPELRIAPRVTSKRRGTAHIAGRTGLDCTVRDVSVHGARLSFHNPTILPRQFRLQFDEHDQRVTVVWQAGVLAGVRFQTPIKQFAQARRKRGWLWSRK